jgi:hypothetical protein
MVLLDQVTPVFDLPQFHVCRQDSGGFDLGNRFRIGGVLSTVMTRGADLLA